VIVGVGVCEGVEEIDEFGVWADVGFGVSVWNGAKVEVGV